MAAGRLTDEGVDVGRTREGAVDVDTQAVPRQREGAIKTDGLAKALVTRASIRVKYIVVKNKEEVRFPLDA